MNGWCIASQLSDSSSHSKNGNSVIHKKLYPLSGTMPICLPTLRRRAPSTGSVTLFLSATISTTSPFSQPSSESIASSSPSLRNFANEQLGASSCQRIYARPFAPIPFENSVSLSISFLVRTPAAFFATIALTLPPAAIAEENTENSVSFTISDRSCISIPKRVSGLSEP